MTTATSITSTVNSVKTTPPKVTNPKENKPVEKPKLVEDEELDDLGVFSLFD